MVCKKCGHNNTSTALKCSACGQDLGANERLNMFQAQAQAGKGISVSLAPAVQEPVNPDEFFGDLPRDPSPSISGVRHAREVETRAPEPTFFQEVKTVEEPAFETKIESLRSEMEEEPPPEHPLYSPPTNSTIEAFIARRAAARPS